MQSSYSNQLQLCEKQCEHLSCQIFHPVSCQPIDAHTTDDIHFQYITWSDDHQRQAWSVPVWFLAVSPILSRTQPYWYAISLHNNAPVNTGLQTEITYEKPKSK